MEYTSVLSALFLCIFACVRLAKPELTGSIIVYHSIEGHLSFVAFTQMGPYEIEHPIAFSTR